MAFSKEQMTRHWGGNVAESLGANRRAAGASAEGAGGADPDEGTHKLRGARWINLDRIEYREQARVDPDPEGLERMAASLRSHGQITPISVRWDGSIGKYVIIAGERRYRGAVLAGLKQIKAEVDDEDGMSPERVRDKQLVENLIREDLRPMELAREFRRMMDARGWPALRLAEEFAISEATVLRAVKLLELPAPVQALVEADRMSRTVANEVAKAPEAERQAIADRIVDEGATVARAAEMVQEARQAAKRRPAGKGGAVRTKGGSAKLKPTIPFRAGGGLVLTAARPKGVEPAALLDALERWAAEVRAGLAEAG